MVNKSERLRKICRSMKYGYIYDALRHLQILFSLDSLEDSQSLDNMIVSILHSMNPSLLISKKLVPLLFWQSISA